MRTEDADVGTGHRVPAAWAGARNWADLGGLPVVGGGHTMSGRVWRSGAPEWMTTEGWRAARAAGLVRVVDLRNAVERGRSGEHPTLDPDAQAGVEVLHTPTEDPDDPEFLAECGPWLDHPRSWEPNARRYPEKVARVFAAIADADGPVLVHCAGGRDRTGMVCSMLLALAGVEPQAIAQSYADGYRGAGAYPGHGLGYDPTKGEWVPAKGDARRSPAELDEEIADRLPVLLEWLRGTDVAAYLSAAGVGPRQLQRLRRLLRPR